MSPLPPMRSRHTPRLSGYDYRQSGMYFVTVVTAKRECLFGDIIDAAMQPNVYGTIATEDWWALSDHFGALTVADFVVMPNHVHGVLLLEGTPPTVSLSVILGAFKSGITRRINLLRETPGATVWQRSFHDRIIRSEGELIRIQEYIAANPLKWALDSENPVNVKPR